jgi:hypothetical protein
MVNPEMSNPADLISQKEKREVLRNDRLARNTYFQHATSSIDDDRGGRYAATEKPATVVGASPVVYPAQPPNSPWRCDPVPPEMPLGYSVEDHEVVGEKHEIEASSNGTVEVEDPPAKGLSHVITDAGGSKKFRRRI